MNYFEYLFGLLYLSISEPNPSQLCYVALRYTLYLIIK